MFIYELEDEWSVARDVQLELQKPVNQ